MVRELQPVEFTERLSPIFETVLAEANYPAKFNPAYFFPHWRRMMELQVVKTWEADEKAVLGALFVPETFSGEKQALCVFWFCLPEQRRKGIGQALFQEFDREARKQGCRFEHSAANVLDHDARGVGYLTRGFEKVETIYRKVLQHG